VQMKIKIIAAIIYTGSVFASGWQVKSWQVDSLTLAIEKAAQKATEKERSKYADHAAEVERILTEKSIHERVIETQLQPIIKREVYQNNCIDDDGLDIINGMFTGPQD